jgi:hypothetical protein
MQLSKIFSISTLLAAASATSVSYDVGYDDPSRSLTQVSCSDGINGLMWKYGWYVDKLFLPLVPCRGRYD